MLPRATQQITDVVLRFQDNSERLITFLVAFFCFALASTKKRNINIVSFPTAALILTGCALRLLLSHCQISICKTFLPRVSPGMESTLYGSFEMPLHFSSGLLQGLYRNEGEIPPESSNWSDPSVER